VETFALTRVPGVLQRLALCYLAAGLLVRWLSVRQILAVGAVLLLGYWRSWSGSARRAWRSTNMATSAPISTWLLGPGHLYKKDAGFDPEGLLGTLPAIVNVLGGYLAGLAVQRGADLARTTRRMALCGLALVGAGLAWSPWFPIAKKLWTGSYVLLTLGIDCLALAAIIAVVELAGRREGTRFFLILGRNPLAIYLFPSCSSPCSTWSRRPRAGSMTGWAKRCSSRSRPARSALCSARWPIPWCAGRSAGRWTARA
jgi:alpha-N-acetylglucosaminidase